MAAITGYEEAFALSKRARMVYVTTLDEGGFPETRVMFNLRRMRAKVIAAGPARLTGDFETYLGTNTGSRKIAQIRHDVRVCLYYTNTLRFQGVQVRGMVEEITDEAVKAALWMPAWRIYYAGGVSGGDFSVLRFIPQQVRYYHGMQVHAFDA